MIPEIAEPIKLIFNPKCTPQLWNAVDRIEFGISKLERAYGEVTERGTPGLYSREILMPAGMLCTSKIHKTHHQFIVSEGAATVYNTLDDSTVIYKSGDHGITLPGTRRVLYIHETCRWTIFHPSNKIKKGFERLSKSEQQVIFDSIFADLTQEYNNPYLENFDDGIFI